MWEHHLSHGLLMTVGGMSFTFSFMLSLYFCCTNFLVICRCGPYSMSYARTFLGRIDAMLTPLGTTWTTKLMSRLALLTLSSFICTSFFFYGLLNDSCFFCKFYGLLGGFLRKEWMIGSPWLEGSLGSPSCMKDLR